MSQPQIILTDEIHRGMNVVTLRFKYNQELIHKVKKIDGIKWSQSKKCWYMQAVEGCYKEITDTLEKYCQLKYEGTENSSLNIESSIDSTKPNTIEEPGDTNKPAVTVEKDYKKNQLFIRFKYNEDWKNEVRKLEGSWWHPGAKVWSAYLNESNIEKLNEIFTSENSTLTIREIVQPDKIKQKQKSNIDNAIVNEKFISQLKLKNRSSSTINSYRGMVAHFLHHYKSEDIALISEEKIMKYILDHREKQGYSESYQRLMISALKSYYLIIFGRVLKQEEIPFPKKSISLPKVIAREDVEKMISLTMNPKHKMILLMLYGLGLRNGELANLKVRDIDFDRGIITIYKAKGRKDRQIPLPKSLEQPVQKYLEDFLVKEYFLIGQYGGKYSSSSIGKVVNKAAIKAQVKFGVTPHVLRHCFATHSLEKGIDLRYIQAMLGHKSSRTTEIYTHVSTKHMRNLGNPLDDIEI